MGKREGHESEIRGNPEEKVSSDGRIRINYRRCFWLMELISNCGFSLSRFANPDNLCHQPIFLLNPTI